MKFCFIKKDFIQHEIAPKKLAIIGSDTELTWMDFEHEVNLYCNALLQTQCDLQSMPVIIYGHKSKDMIVAIYACIKLEVSYIPVDIIYPLDRIKKVKNAARVSHVINTTKNALELENTKEWCMEKKKWESHGVIKETEAFKENDPLVYTIFTSGSTGEPKGVMISTEAVQSFTRWMTSDDFKFTSEEIFINTAILSFDLSVFELMTFSALGATLLLNSKEVIANPHIFLDRIEKYKGSVWVSTPSFAFSYSRLESENRMGSIHTFLFCGEVLPNPLAKSLLNNFPGTRVLNTYGPTEATVATTIVEITSEVIEQYQKLPVGKCRSEAGLTIEDGEIIISGPHVSLGYMNQPELNRLKFIERNGKRAFKTGDEGYLEDGMLFFQGRNDDLVKLHGYRIELNEITSSLLELSYIFQAETIALKRNGTVKKIVSLLACKESEKQVNKEQIKKDLSSTLPHYMIPSDFKFLSSIPLNANGKTDKKLLESIYLKRT